jgi:hypothetical protein
VDNEAFKAYMKGKKKPANTIHSYLRSLELYADFLRSHRQIGSPDEAGPLDVKEFVTWGTAGGENVYRHFWAVRMYYEFKQLGAMVNTVQEWMEYLQNETRKLGEFPKVNKDSVKKLSAMGLRTVNQFLKAANTPAKLAAIAEQSGAPREAVLELYKLSQLSRLPGLKKVRGRLFYEAGLDTLESIASLEPEEVHSILKDFVERSGFKASVPTAGEAEVAIRMARFMPADLTE